MASDMKILRCLNCDYQWKSKEAMSACTECGHVYVLWVNYAQWQKAHHGN